MPLPQRSIRLRARRPEAEENEDDGEATDPCVIRQRKEPHIGAGSV